MEKKITDPRGLRKRAKITLFRASRLEGKVKNRGIKNARKK